MTAITPEIGDSVKELRELRDTETEEEFLSRMKRRGASVVPKWWFLSRLLASSKTENCSTWFVKLLGVFS